LGSNKVSSCRVSQRKHSSFLGREGLGNNNENIKLLRGIMLREWLVPWGRHFS